MKLVMESFKAAVWTKYTVLHRLQVLDHTNTCVSSLLLLDCYWDIAALTTEDFEIFYASEIFSV